LARASFVAHTLGSADPRPRSPHYIEPRLQCYSRKPQLAHVIGAMLSGPQLMPSDADSQCRSYPSGQL